MNTRSQISSAIVLALFFRNTSRGKLQSTDTRGPGELKVKYQGRAIAAFRHPGCEPKKGLKELGLLPEFWIEQ
jgi:hypothetical protein